MISAQKRTEVYNKYQGRCAYCGIYLAKEDMQIDHIHPISKKQSFKGGINDIANLNPSCKFCNSLKGNMSIEQFRTFIQSKRIELIKNKCFVICERYRLIDTLKSQFTFFFER